MKFKGTAGMMVVFLFLGIYYFFVDLPAEKKKAQEKEIAGKILPFKKENIKEFSLVKQDQTIIILQICTSSSQMIKFFMLINSV